MRLVGDDRRDRAGDVGRVIRIEILGGVAADLGQHARARACHCHTARHRLERWKSEALEQRWEREACGAAVERRHPLEGNGPELDDTLLQAQLADALA